MLQPVEFREDLQGITEPASAMKWSRCARFVLMTPWSLESLRLSLSAIKGLTGWLGWNLRKFL